ncbi:STAS domain-containing protein [Streptomyces formicae]|uniref:Anti-anti-sigma factor, putative n=1 Tax=Streptomyces formicae TaxID=1616117 RepID=A0A291QJ21_9ACTN|nr:STAS domain-containing protein [Streptomyces formicae]ATL31445.1 anti-anti-sigma factor, putative [Streptomyces formicae]
MTRPVSRLSLRIESQQGVLTVHVGGSLEYGVTESLVTAVREQLDAPREHGRIDRNPSPVRQLRLDLTELTFVDSMGLAALLMVRRVADAHGVALRLDNRPRCVDRLLQLTGTLDHLTAARAPGETGASDGRGRRISGTD